MWAEIYENLRKCRLNVFQVYPAEYLTISLHDKPDSPKNFNSVRQDRCKDMQVHQILRKDGRIKNAHSMPEGRKPLLMELKALRIATENKLDKLRVKAFGIEGELNIQELRPAPSNFNIYGRIVFKKRKGCSRYYRLLHESRIKHNCWTNAKHTHENEVYIHDKDYMYDNAIYDK